MNKIITYTTISFITLLYLFFFSSELVVLTNLNPLIFNMISSIIVFFMLDIFNKLYIKKYQLNKIELIFIYLIYLIILGYLLFFKNNYVVNSYTFDLIPYFFTSPDSLQYQLMIGNIIMFIPLGFLFKRYIKLPISLFFIIIISIVIEGLQFYLKVGVFDLSDILLYFIGFYIGYIYYFITKSFSDKYNNLSYDTRLIANIFIISIIIFTIIYFIFFNNYIE